jgi:uncharacterized membrane protein
LSPRHRDLAATAALATVAALIVMLGPGLLPLRVILALPLVVALPGYSLTAALFPDREIDWARRLVLSVALSLCLGVVIGLALNLMPFGLRAGPWAAALLCVTLIATAVAVVRRRRRRPIEPVTTRILRVRFVDVALILAAACVLGGAVAFARTPLTAKKAQGYTALWLLRGSGKETATLRVGVTSGELNPMTYRLVVRLGPRVVYERRRFPLQPGEEVDEVLDLGGTASASRQAIEALLYLENRPQSIYRVVRLWPPKKIARP